MISLFMEGIKNVVAIKGTALTENQVNLSGAIYAQSNPMFGSG